ALLSLVFLSLFCHHRDLHSFPTRRSSDLDLRFDSGLIYTGGGKVVNPGNQSITTIISGLSSGAMVAPITQLGRLFYLTKSGANRSEEHTSELQSRSDIVCRLLLEKKNKTR